MKELKLGIMNRADLADWFNTTEQNLQKHRKDKLKILEKYCKFDVLNTKEINILKIYDSSQYQDSRVIYKIGDAIGPHKSILLERFYQKGHSYGKFKCSYCGETFISRIDIVANGTTSSCGCKNKEANLQKRIDLTGKRYGKLTAIKDIGTKDNRRLWLCKCDCGRETTIITSNWGSIKSCGHCNYSIGEEVIEKILLENNINFERQKTFKDCKNIFPLRFDFYLPKFNILIEYDGIQHFQYKENSDWNTKENYEKMKINDNIKNQWCIKNNQPLIRIPYTHLEKIKIEDLLNNSTFFIN